MHASILTRTVRIAASPLSSEFGEGSNTPSKALNGLLGSNPWGISAVGEFEIEARGAPAASGYIVDISVLDAAVRAAAANRFRDASQTEARTGHPTDVVALVAAVAEQAAGALPIAITALTYRPSPFRSISIERPSAANNMNQSHRAVISETFEFAAAHRLNLPELSAEENRRLFGKCNNPNGHGHNYRIEVAVAVDAGSPPRFGFPALQSLVEREIMARFDHKHLNLDCPEYANLNPSVEHIARVCHGLLDSPIRQGGGELRFVRVWETDKTSCRYPG